MISIQIEDPFVSEVSPDLLVTTARTALEHEKAPSTSELSIVISDDNELHQLNQQFLGIDAPTDVLSFPSDEIDPDSGNRYLGDIIISYPRALEQSQKGGHPVTAEIQLLAVHGVLHLLGYDHAEPDEKEKMWKTQAEILHILGNPMKNIPE